MSTEEAPALRIEDVPLFKEYMQKVWAGTEELFAGDHAALDKTVTVKGLGDMPAITAIGYICLAHAMTHVGEISMVRALAGAKSGRASRDCAQSRSGCRYRPPVGSSSSSSCASG